MIRFSFLFKQANIVDAQAVKIQFKMYRRHNKAKTRNIKANNNRAHRKLENTIHRINDTWSTNTRNNKRNNFACSDHQKRIQRRSVYMQNEMLKEPQQKCDPDPQIFQEICRAHRTTKFTTHFANEIEYLTKFRLDSIIDRQKCFNSSTVL